MLMWVYVRSVKIRTYEARKRAKLLWHPNLNAAAVPGGRRSVHFPTARAVLFYFFW
jgi:hypothetical protein